MQKKPTNQPESFNIIQPDSDVVLKVEGVSKKFCRNLKRSMWYGTADATRNMLGVNYDHNQLRKDEFWALQDINFELRKGECLGIIGPNGSGKSSLLRLLTGIFPPDKGKITTKGRIGALIAVGAGFHPHMTGRENIYLNGVILGMSRQEVAQKFEEIVEFAEIGEFIDAPVSTYSSGMKVRLGFSIAINISPNILFVDEVLSVGDYAFREKCTNKMESLYKSKDTSVIFISHNYSAVLSICNKVLWLEKGQIKARGETEEIVTQYLSNQEEKIQKTERVELSTNNNKVLYNSLIINEIKAICNGIETTKIKSGADLKIIINYTADIEIVNPNLVIHISHKQKIILVADMFLDGKKINILKGKGEISCVFSNLSLVRGNYTISFMAFGKTPYEKIVFPPLQLSIVVEQEELKDKPMDFIRSKGVLVNDYFWE